MEEEYSFVFAFLDSDLFVIALRLVFFWFHNWFILFGHLLLGLFLFLFFFVTLFFFFLFRGLFFFCQP